MTISTLRHLGARDAAAGLLDTLGLEAYLFEVELGDNDDWNLTLECVTGDGWQRLSCPLEERDLLRSVNDRLVRARMAAELARQIGMRRRATIR